MTTKTTLRKTEERKTIQVGSKRIALRSLLHGKEIREAAKALEDCRLALNEEEFLYGAKLIIKWESYGDIVLSARRPETDEEMATRLEKARIASEKKAEQERKRIAMEAEQREKCEQADRKAMLERIKAAAKKLKITEEEMREFLDFY